MDYSELDMSAPYCNKNGKISINALQSVEWSITELSTWCFTANN